jgi:hypothetical protein
MATARQASNIVGEYAAPERSFRKWVLRATKISHLRRWTATNLLRRDDDVIFLPFHLVAAEVTRLKSTFWISK